MGSEITKSKKNYDNGKINKLVINQWQKMKNLSALRAKQKLKSGH